MRAFLAVTARLCIGLITIAAAFVLIWFLGQILWSLANLNQRARPSGNDLDRARLALC